MYARILIAMKRLPGVMSAAAADAAPLGTNMGWNIYFPGYVPTRSEPAARPRRTESEVALRHPPSLGVAERIQS
jgi:hypothetical protein